MAFCAIVLSCLFLASFDQSKGQNWDTDPASVHSSPQKDADISDQNNYAGQTSLRNSTETLTIHNQWTQNQGQYNETATSISIGYDIFSEQQNNKTQLQQKYQPQNQSEDFPWQSQNTEGHDNHFTLWNNSTNQTHTKLSQNSSEDKNTSHNSPIPNSHGLGGINITDDLSSESPVLQLAEGTPVSNYNWEFGPVIKLKPDDTSLVGGEKLTEVKAPLLQWHVGIYSKAFEPYMQICGGTLVTTKAVISAAHCFWSDLDGALPASLFMVAAGKLYRPWNDPHDLYAQKSEISAVHLPTRFRGAITSFQDDIAAVMLATALVRSPGLRPLCVLFDEDLEHTQLRKGNEGIVLGWGLTAENGPPAQALQFLYMPYVPTQECVADSEANFLKYITSDKICAGVTTGKALCRGDSGGGLVFFVETSNERVPLLLGVASTAPRNKNLCNTHARATLTRVLAHRAFLRAHIPDIEEACGKNYVTFASDVVQAPLIETRFAEPEKNLPQATRPTKSKFICNCYCNNSTKH